MKEKTVERADSLIKKLVEDSEIEELKRQLMKKWARGFYSSYIQEAKENYHRKT